ncbi:cache domain-containing sensor histidine kinase [Cohnella lubricantis]|uniref:Sensor histidine kinase n=1 Tax=Cohnella lubricantis TaxID=2163172 RepID=A0A841TGM8_9BACL|nr:sensor histidine kinase [Cohnella lubricantis]MBB6678390.1 sensor histidine kinase [Cohnella lubricantis]MBP2116770.1 two-component system sensor histidine kinase YesM [Cohnella lubricantis]
MAKLREINTLRNQIFAGFTITMIVVLAFAGVFIYDRVSDLLRNSAEKHIQQTAVQANGRLDALLDQIDSLTTQVATDANVQKLLLKEASGEPSNFNERQSLLQIVNSYMAYTSGIQSIELYTMEDRLFPLDDISLQSRVPESWIREADRLKGRLIWVGLDPRQSDNVLAIRQIRLIDRSYSAGGYLTVHMNRDYFYMNEQASGGGERSSSEFMLLADSENHAIASDMPAEEARAVLEQTGSTVSIRGEQFLTVRLQSEKTGWSLVLLTPIQAATEGISVLRTAILVSIGISAIAFLMLTLLLSTMITRPILKLMKTMRDARFGGLKPIPAAERSLASIEIRELNHTYNKMVSHLNELIQVVYEKEITQSRTELKALQAQINPHFLFNTLEAFYWSLDDKGEEELARIVVAMSGLFRYVIGNAGGTDEWVTVNDELEHAKRYLQIMKMRLGDRLAWRIEADPELTKKPIPKLLIQPLVENAILHGVEGKLGTGTVIIRVAPSASPGIATITIQDDGPGMDEETLAKLKRSIEGTQAAASSKGAGIALSNVQRRLKLYYPDAANSAERLEGLRFASIPGEGTSVSFDITIPHGGGRYNDDDLNR